MKACCYILYSKQTGKYYTGACHDDLAERKNIIFMNMANIVIQPLQAIGNYILSCQQRITRMQFALNA
jgi:hypothetical protein